MIVVQEKKQPLNEMAQFKAAGITVKVYSNDHGAMGNESSPAHTHVFDAAGKKELGAFVLTKKIPKSPADIQWYRTPNPPAGLGNAIVKFANAPNKALQAIETQAEKATNWNMLIATWITFQGK